MMFANRRLLVASLLAVVVGVAGACTAVASPVAPAHSAARSHAAKVTPAAVSPARTSAATPSPTAARTRAPSSATGGPVALGGNMCSLLGPGDFAAAGVAGASAPTVNSDENGGRYCVYAGKSGATGGIEFDAFTGDPVGTYQTIAGETGTLTELAATDLPGADQAGVNLSGTGGVAAIVVRKGQLIFDMSFPGGPQARAELIALSALVMERAAALE
jgi:hypothetical protein